MNQSIAMRDGAGYVYPAAAAYARKYDRHQLEMNQNQRSKITM